MIPGNSNAVLKVKEIWLRFVGVISEPWVFKFKFEIEVTNLEKMHKFEINRLKNRETTIVRTKIDAELRSIAIDKYNNQTRRN